MGDAELQRIVYEMEVEEGFRSYNQVVQLAFRSCVHGFRSNTLTDKEKKCVTATAGKMLRFADRLGHRFSESQVKMSADGTPPK